MAGRLRSLICLSTCLLLLGAPFATTRTACAYDLDQLRQAASEGEPAALFRLGDLHERGEGVPRDLKRAFRYTRLAAERGHAEAQYRLGLYLATGLGDQADLKAGYSWLALAAESDLPIALVAAALRDQVAEQLDEEALAAAQEQVAAFEPAAGPASLPEAPAETVAEAAATAEEFEGLLPPTDCGAVRVAVADGGLITVSGHLAAGRSAGAWRNKAGAALPDRQVAFDLLELDGSLCRVLELLARDPARPGAGPALTLRDAGGEAKQVFEAGDELVIKVGPLGARRHVFIDYFVHDGDVLHMAPEDGAAAEALAEGASLTLGDPDSGGQTWEIGPPFGRDLLVVFASERPLYSGERPVVEPTADYLEFLRNRLESPLPGDAIEANYRVVTTQSG